MDEALISRAITESFTKDFINSFNVDVAIAGGGPSGLICGYYLAKKGYKVALFERQLKLGGGMPGGGMMFNRIVIQNEAMSIVKEFGISSKKYRKNLFILDSLETIAALSLGALKKGVRIFNLMSVDDVVVRKDKVCGLVLNWSATDWTKLHVDPLAIKSKAVVDATGHDSEIARLVERKMGPQLVTESGRVVGEKSMWAEVGEKKLIENTREIYPGLVVTGMASNAVFGSPRMGAIFGGMLLSGKHAADVVKKIIK